MRKRQVCLIAGCLAVGFATVAPSAAQALRAGAAKVDISPRPGDLKIATDSIRDPLYARAIVVEDGRSCAVLAGIDGGAPDSLAGDIAARITASTKCPAGNVILAGTHSHSTMPGGGPAGDAATSQRWANAIVAAAEAARARLAPARIGFATATVDLNVNRDNYNKKLEWRQEPNPDGTSDKTLAVMALVGADDVPIGVVMNYAMHPINFYLSGVISADFPGEASRYVEEMFDGRAVAIFTQGASGDQNPRLFNSPSFFLSQRQALAEGRGPFPQTLGPPVPPGPQSAKGFNPAAATSERKAIPPENLEAYKKTIARTGDYVVMMGTLLGSTAVRVMREDMRLVPNALIWGGNQTITCPGRMRRDAADPSRENVFPGYNDAPDVDIRVGLLRIGDVHLVSVNGEVYSKIALRLKGEAPAAKTFMVTNVSPRAASGYIYSDDAYSHLSFQVIGSRLKPGCAEDKIVSSAIELMHRAEAGGGR